DYCLLCVFIVFFFFFSSRRRHTRFDCDWSSDVCSSDLRCSCPGRAGLFWSQLKSARPGQEHLHEVSHEDKVELVPLMARTLGNKIGRASCRERVWRSEGGGGVEERGEAEGGASARR